MNDKLTASKSYLANLLEAIQRCVFFLHGSESRIDWPLDAKELASRNKDIDLFEALSAINERFAKLQDTLAGAMRHAAILSGEPPADTFLRVLAFYEKVQVISSIEDWQNIRALRNLATHEYELDYSEIVDHFNSIKEMLPNLYTVARTFLTYCSNKLNITPASQDFTPDFKSITSSSQVWRVNSQCPPS